MVTLAHPILHTAGKGEEEALRHVVGGHTLPGRAIHDPKGAAGRQRHDLDAELFVLEGAIHTGSTVLARAAS